MTKFKVFYDDKPPFISPDDGGPELVPVRGVQVIIQEDNYLGISVVSGGDYYTWRDEKWWPVDINGLFDYLCMPGWKRVLMGRTILQEEYNKIMRQACVEKETWHPFERKTTN